MDVLYFLKERTRLIRQYYELAAKYHLPVMFHTGTYVQSDLLAVAELTRRYPATVFVAGFGGVTDMWFELPGVFAETSNLLLDASMMWGEAIRQIAAEHGPERVLFGSAEPRNRYGAALRALERLNLDEAARLAILYKNARRIFRWA